MVTDDYHPDADSPRCIVCHHPTDDPKTHHLNAIQVDNRPKNLVAYCSEHCHTAIHNGTCERGLVLWRKLHPDAPTEAPHIGYGDLSDKLNRLYRLDIAIERAYDEATDSVDPSAGMPSPNIDHAFWLDDIDGRNQFVTRFKSELLSYTPTEGTHVHRTRPVELTKTATGYQLRLPILDGKTVSPEQLEAAYLVFQNTLGGEQSLNTFSARLEQKATLSES